MPGSEKFSVPSELQALESKVPPPPHSPPDFKWGGWSNGGKDQNRKKIPWPKINPQKIPSRIFEPQLFCLYIIRRTTRLGYAESTTNLKIVLNTPPPPPKNPSLIKPPKKYLPNFPNQKKSGNRKFQTLKSASIIPVKWNPRVKAAFSSSLTILCRQLGCWGRKSKQKI